MYTCILFSFLDYFVVFLVSLFLSCVVWFVLHKTTLTAHKTITTTTRHTPSNTTMEPNRPGQNAIQSTLSHIPSLQNKTEESTSSKRVYSNSSPRGNRVAPSPRPEVNDNDIETKHARLSAVIQHPISGMTTTTLRFALYD